MMLKEALTFLLITGTLVLCNDDNSRGESLELTENEEFYVKPERHFENKNVHAAHQFEKDYNRWSDKSNGKHSSEESREKDRHLKRNEIEEDLYVEKYNKYGKFKTNFINLQKDRTNYHDKRDSDNEKHHEGRVRLEGLINDINVNYIKNNKKISDDSELITETSVEKLKNKEEYQENYQNKNDMNMKRYKKDFYQNMKKIDLSIPPANDTVKMARYIVHSVDWAAVATLSGRSPTKGAPFVCVKATSDGMANASSGIPFFYMSPLDICAQDILKDNRVSVLVTLSETEYCKTENIDPQDPRCAKLTLSGKMKKIKPGSDEEKFAKSALFSRHPAMKTWPTDHDWHFSKLKIGQIILLDQYGGATYIKVKDYLNGEVLPPQL